MNQRQKIEAAIEAGGATEESLMEDVGCKTKGVLSSNFTYLRWMGKHPVKGEDGIFYFATDEQWAEIQANKPAPGAAAAAALTPEQRLEKAIKRVARAASALTNADSRYEANATRINELNLTKAQAELELAEILEGEADEAFRNAPPVEEVEVPDNDGVEETEVEEDADLI